MREIFSLGKLKGINLTRFSPQFSPHFSPHMSGARFTASTICTFFLEILKKISPVRSAELPKVGDGGRLLLSWNLLHTSPCLEESVWLRLR